MMNVKSFIILSYSDIIIIMHKNSLSEADRIHMMVESKKLAFEDRFKMLGDPEKVTVNCGTILNKEYCDKRRLNLDMKVANNKNVDDPEEGADTTYFIVVDSEGDYLVTTV
jgi:gamma-glutamyltranspeptidase/glutathione hydrolase